MKSLVMKGLSLSYGAMKVFEGLDAEFPSGSVTALLGPSGCGKTSLLNIIAGLIQPDAGRIIGSESGGCSYCFQEPRLLPWLGARDNILFALSRFMDKKDSERRADKALAQTNLSQFAAAAPSKLSGGMRRRLALARAFAYPSDLLLLDEAFASVDLKQRIELLDLFIALWSEEPRTTLLVSHEIQDALYVADRIIVLSARPARILGSFEIPLPRERRRYGSGDLLILEEKLYSLILS
jgi:NitT/TauT family transport system ATP-binding protein